MNETILSYKFIRKPTAESLEKEIERLQLIHGEKIKFQYIQFANNNWYAWYEYTKVVTQRALR
jgi:hypothetical protein